MTFFGPALVNSVLEARGVLLRYLRREDIGLDLADSSDPEKVAAAIPDAIRAALVSERAAGRHEMLTPLLCGHPAAVLWVNTTNGDGPRKRCPWCLDVRLQIAARGPKGES